MARLIDLVQYGWAVTFGLPFGNPIQPATFSVPAGETVAVASGNNRAQTWQKEAWRLYHLLGEIHYPTTKIARQGSQVEWFVRINGRLLTPDTAKAEMARVTAGLGPQEATYLLTLNDEVAGESWYIEEEDDKFAVWSVVENDLDKKVDRARGAGRITERMWQADPTDPRKADSSVRTAIGPAVELLTYEALAQSQARSRMQAGVIITPAEQLYSNADPWEQNLYEALTAGIKNVESPSAIAPIHVSMRRDLIDFVRYLTFPRPYDDLIDKKQERAIRRVANALDIEPEVLLGLGDASYWNAWAVTMDMYQAHLAPRLDRIGHLYSVVLERLRERSGQGGVVEITPDPRVMLARRATVRDAMDAHKLYVVGPSYVRDAIGASEADAPTPEELEVMERVLGGGSQDMDRERRVGENPGPARSGDSQGARGVVTDLEVAEHARKALGLKLREAWRNTPQSNRLSGLMPSDYTCYIPLGDISREFDYSLVIAEAVAEMGLNGGATRLASWIIRNLTVPFAALGELEETNV